MGIIIHVDTTLQLLLWYTKIQPEAMVSGACLSIDAHVRFYNSTQRKNGFHFTELCSTYRILRITCIT